MGPLTCDFSGTDSINRSCPHISSSHCVCLQPGNYQRTVKRTEDSFQACNDIVACFQERARLERQYAQQLSEWSTKWKPVVDSSRSSVSAAPPPPPAARSVSHLPLSVLRSAVRLAPQGLAVLPVLGQPAGLPPCLHLSLAGVGGRRPGQDLAEGHLPQEAVWRL